MRLTKASLFLLPLLCVVLFLVGCGGSSWVSKPVVSNPVENDPGENSPSPSPTQALLSISIDWNAFPSSRALSTKKFEGTLDVTSVGARLVYHEENASFAQSVSKETAESEGVITLQVPPAERASLFVVAVHEGSDWQSERALYLGSIHDFALQSDTMWNITVNDINWVDAGWEIADTHLEGYSNGSFVTDKDELRFTLPIRVRDPFQVGESPSRGKLAIKLSGTGWEYENIDGWRRILVNAQNEEVGRPSTTVESFWPYLDGSLFELSKTYYFIGDEGLFAIDWK